MPSSETENVKSCFRSSQDSVTADIQMPSSSVNIESNSRSTCYGILVILDAFFLNLMFKIFLKKKDEFTFYSVLARSKRTEKLAAKK